MSIPSRILSPDEDAAYSAQRLEDTANRSCQLNLDQLKELEKTALILLNCDPSIISVLTGMSNEHFARLAELLPTHMQLVSDYQARQQARAARQEQIKEAVQQKKTSPHNQNNQIDWEHLPANMWFEYKMIPNHNRAGERVYNGPYLYSRYRKANRSTGSIYLDKKRRSAKK